MGEHFISEEEYDDFMFDNEDTNPMILLTTQEQINSSNSLLSFIAQADSKAVKQHWCDSLSYMLDSAYLDQALDEAFHNIQKSINIGHGWAGRTAK